MGLHLYNTSSELESKLNLKEDNSRCLWGQHGGIMGQHGGNMGAQWGQHRKEGLGLRVKGYLDISGG